MKLKQQSYKIGIIGYESNISKEFKKAFENYIDREKIGENIYNFYDYKAKEKFSIIGEFKKESVIVKYPEIKSLIENDIIIITSPFNETDKLKKGYKGILIDISDSLSDYDLLYDSESKAGIKNAKKIKLPSASSYSIYRILKPIKDSFGLKYVNSTILFPVSIKEGGINELLTQTIDTLNIKNINPEIFPSAIAFSFSGIDSNLEEMINSEVKTLLHSENVRLAGFVAPIFHSISFFVFFKTEKPIERDIFRYSYDITNIFKLTDEKVISPKKASETDKIILSEIKEFNDTEFFINAAADNYKTAVLNETINLLKELLE